jgi:Protein of unknown function (DUF4058)
MNAPFPGMDPYLESPALWPDVHNRLIVALADSLGALLALRYYVSLQERIQMVRPDDQLLIGIPDLSVVAHLPRPAINNHAVADVDVVEVTFEMDELREAYLEIYNSDTREVVTIIELLSPINKQGSRGRREYEDKRDAVLGSLTSFVEIDLLRAGKPMPVFNQRESDYRICLARGMERRRGWLYPFGVRKPIPPIALPLLPGDTEPIINLTSLLHETYQRARYDLQIDYSKPPTPPLSDADAAWARELTAQPKQ